MMTRPVLWTLIIVTAVLFAILNLLAQETLASALCVVVGLAWLTLEIRRSDISRVVFFLFFVGMAILNSLKNAPTPLILLALSTSLAAWDLSSFGARIAALADDEDKTALERNHLHKLGVTAAIGFLAALIPLFVQISIPFVAFGLLLLVAIAALSNAVSALLGDREQQ